MLARRSPGASVAAMDRGGLALIDGNAAEATRLGAYPLASNDIPAAAPALLLVTAGRFSVVAGSMVPVIVLDAPGEPRARAALLDAGAADLVPFDIDPIELGARVRAILRRGAALRCGDLAIDLAERRATRAGRALPLHPREFDVLAHLARHEGGIVTRAALYAAVWQRRFDPGSNVVSVTVSRMRAKLEMRGHPPLIHTRPGGYMLATLAGG